MSPIEKAMLLVEHCGGIDRFKHADGTPMTLEELAEILDTAHRKQGKLFQHTTTELKVKIAYLQLA